MPFLGVQPSRGLVGTAGIDDDAIDSQHYAAGSIDTAHIAANQIDGTLTKDALIADYSDVTITASDLIMYGDATDSNNTKRATVQGILELAGGGAWTFLATTAISSDTSVTFTGLDATYDTHVFIISDLDVATDDKDLYMVVGDSGGLDTGSSDYKWAGYARGAAATPDASSGDGGDPKINLSMGGSGIGNAAGETYGGIVYLHTPTDGAGFPSFTSKSEHNRTDGNPVWITMGAQRMAVITLTQVQFKLESDATMTAGRISAYGIKHS